MSVVVQRGDVRTEMGAHGEGLNVGRDLKAAGRHALHYETD